MKTILGISEILDKEQLSSLDNFVIQYNKIMHKLYVDLIIKKLKQNELKSSYIKKYNISARQFNSISMMLKGKVQSILELNKIYIKETKQAITKIEKNLKFLKKNLNKIDTNEVKDILPKLETNINNEKNIKSTLSKIEKSLSENKRLKIKYNNQKLIKLKNKLKDLNKILETGDVKLCFGSQKLFNQQFQINTANNLTKYKTFSAWLKDWFFNRHKSCDFVGSKDENSGNNESIISHVSGNTFNIKLNINHTEKDKSKKYVNFNFTMNYEDQTLINIINNNKGSDKNLWQALTVKLTRQQGCKSDRYLVNISFEKQLVKKVYLSKNNGCIGVDINQDHLAVVNLDSKGNLLNINKYYYDLNSNNSHKNLNSISHAVKELITFAVKLNKLITIEKLDFSAKKLDLRLNDYQVKSRNKQLSSFSYNKIIMLIKARAEDNFIEIKEVNPAYTSLIGFCKYRVTYKISTHHAAAMVIGRRSIFSSGYQERKISSNNKQLQVSVLPVRNKLENSVYWKELKKECIKVNLIKKNRLKSISKPHVPTSVQLVSLIH